MVNKPGKHQISKQTDLCWQVLYPANLLYYHCLLIMHAVHNQCFYWLVHCMSTHKHLLYFARYCAGSTPKLAPKKHTTRNFAMCLNNFPLLTMIKLINDNQSARESLREPRCSIHFLRCTHFL